MRIEEALEKFVTQLEADGRSSHTINQYRRHAHLFAQWVRDVGPRGDDLAKIDHEVVARFLAAPAATGSASGGKKKATSANCLRSSLKVFLSYCHRAGYLAQDPGRLIRRARCSPPPPRGMSDEDQKKLLQVLAAATGPEAERDHALILVMLRAGIRVGSAVALDVEDVDLERAELAIRKTKGNAPERVFLADDLRDHLRRYIGDRTAGALFPGRDGEPITVRHAERRFSQWLERAGVQRDASPHSLRHAFAMRVYRKSKDILLTQAALRHRSIASTTVYARVDEERLRQVI